VPRKQHGQRSIRLWHCGNWARANALALSWSRRVSSLSRCRCGLVGMPSGPSDSYANSMRRLRLTEV